MPNKIKTRYRSDVFLGPREYYYLNSNATIFLCPGGGVLCQVIVNKDATDNLILQDIGGATTTTAILGVVNGTSSAMGLEIFTDKSTTFTNPTYVRPLVVTPSGTTNDVAACVIKVRGTDWQGNAITEYFTFAANATAPTYGSQYFATVNEVEIPGQDGIAAKFAVGAGEGSMIANLTNPRKGDRYNYFIKLNQGLKVYSGTTGDYTITYIND